MKKVKSALLTATLSASVLSCGLVGTNFYVPAQAADSAAIYHDVLDMYYQYISDGWADHEDGVYGTEDVTAQNYSYLWFHNDKDKTLSETGYQFIDLNNDGVDELLVSVMDISEDNYSDMVYDIYTYYNGNIVHLAASGERDSFFIGNNGEICERGSGGASITEYDYYLIDNGSLKCSEVYLFDAYEDENQPYFHASNPDSSYYDSYGDIITSKMEHITKEEYDAGISAHTYQKLNLTPFSEYTSDDNSTSDKCGDNAYWAFDEATRTLTISGTGDMYDYGLYAYEETPAPWFMRSGTYSTEGIKHVVIQDGITHIGDCSLFGTAIESVKLPESLKSIGQLAFHDCNNLKEITIPRSVITIEDRGFGQYGNSGEGVIEGLTVYGYTGSATQEYVSQVNSIKGATAQIKFVALDSDAEPEMPVTSSYETTYSHFVYNTLLPEIGTAAQTATFPADYDMTQVLGIVSTAVYDFGSDGVPELLVITREAEPNTLGETTRASNNYMNTEFYLNLYRADENGNVVLLDRVRTIEAYPVASFPGEIHDKLEMMISGDAVYLKSNTADYGTSGLNAYCNEYTVFGVADGKFTKYKLTVNRVSVYDSTDTTLHHSFDGVLLYTDQNIDIEGLEIDRTPGIYTTLSSLNDAITKELTNLGLNFKSATVSVEDDNLSLALNIDVTPAVQLVNYSFAEYDGTNVYQFLNRTMIAETTEDNNILSGKCGENAYWTFDKTTGTLTISGTGSVTENSWNTEIPVDENGYSDIKHIVIEAGITQLHNNGGFGVNISSISLPDTLTYIDDWYFSYIGDVAVQFDLKEVTVPASVTYIGEHAFNSQFCGDGSIFTYYDDLTIKGYTNSAAQKYAEENQIHFIALDAPANENEPSENSNSGTSGSENSNASNNNGSSNTSNNSASNATPSNVTTTASSPNTKDSAIPAVGLLALAVSAIGVSKHYRKK